MQVESANDLLFFVVCDIIEHTRGVLALTCTYFACLRLTKGYLHRDLGAIQLDVEVVEVRTKKKMRMMMEVMLQWLQWLRSQWLEYQRVDTDR